MPLSVWSISRQDVEDDLSYVADIQSVRSVEVRNKVAGFLDAIYVDEGKAVRQGQVLFKINDEEYRVNVSVAQSNLQAALAEANTAEIELERVRTLTEKQVVSEVELKMAKAKRQVALAKVEQARAELRRAELSLSYTQIKAPFDGIVDRIPLKIGSLLPEGTLLTHLYDNMSMYAYFKVTEKEYLEYMKERVDRESESYKVRLQLADGSIYPYEGVVETLEGDFDHGAGSIAFRARFPNPERLLKHGATGKILLKRPLKNVFLIPQRAVLEMQDKNYVYVLNQHNRTVLRSFVPLKRIGKFYVVQQGFQDGERIVVEGIQELRQDVWVKPEPVNIDSL